MARPEIVISAFLGRWRAALRDDDGLICLGLEPAPGTLARGDVVLGRVTAVDRNLDAAFVDVGEARPGVLMRADAGGGRIVAGAAVVVQVIRPALGGKGAKLTARLALTGRYLVWRPAAASVAVPAADGAATLAAARQRLADAVATRERHGAGGWFLREAARPAADCEILAEADALLARHARISAAAAQSRAPDRLDRALAPALALVRDAAGVERIVCDDPVLAAEVKSLRPDLADRLQVVLAPGGAFAAFGVDGEIEAALSPVLGLKGGGRLQFAETPAVATIDVDTAAAGDGAAERTAFAVNREAAAAIGRAIRVRELAGTIVVDFLPMRRPEQRARLLDALARGSAGDDRRPRIGGFTRLGLVELRRERVGPTLARALAADCAACGGQGWVRSPRETAAAALSGLLAAGHARPHVHYRLAVPAAVAAILENPADPFRQWAEGRVRRRIVACVDPSLPADRFRLDEAASGSGAP